MNSMRIAIVSYGQGLCKLMVSQGNGQTDLALSQVDVHVRRCGQLQALDCLELHAGLSKVRCLFKREYRVCHCDADGC